MAGELSSREEGYAEESVQGADCLRCVIVFISNFFLYLFVALRPALFPVADGYEWVGTATFSNEVITRLFAAASRGAYDEEKSVNHFWKKLPEDSSSADHEESDDEVILEPIMEEAPKELEVVNDELDELDVGLIRIEPGRLLETETFIVEPVHLQEDANEDPLMADEDAIEEPVHLQEDANEDPIMADEDTIEEPVQAENSAIEVPRERPPKRKSSEAARLALSRMVEDDDTPPCWKKFRPAGARAPEFSVEMNSIAIIALMSSVEASKQNTMLTICTKVLPGLENLEVMSSRTIQRRRYCYESINAAHLEEVVKLSKGGFLLFDDAVLCHTGRKATAIVYTRDDGVSFVLGLYETFSGKSAKMSERILQALRGLPYWKTLATKISIIVTDSAHNQRRCNEIIIDELKATEGVVVHDMYCQEKGRFC